MEEDDAGAVAVAVGAAWTAARGWLTPAVLFLAINLVIATIAVASRLMPGRGDDNDDDEAAGEPRGRLHAARAVVPSRRPPPPAPLAVQLLPPRPRPRPRPRGAGGGGALVRPRSGDDGDPEPSLQEQPVAEVDQQLEHEHQRAEARIESSRSEAPHSRRRRRRPRARAAEELDGHGGAEVDARADDFIRRFREQLRLQRLDSILRFRDRRDSLRRTGTA